MDILCHRGYWKKKNEQNKLPAILKAFASGYGVEIDLRLDSKGRIYLAHDPETENLTYLDEVLEAVRVRMDVNNFKDIPLLALHIKEDTIQMAEAVCKLVNPTQKLILFGLSEDSKLIYADVFGWSKIAYEFETGLMGNSRKASKGPEGIVWLVERAWSLGHEEYERLAHKKIYYITPEIVNYRKELTDYHLRYVKGICTDVPEFYQKIINKNATT